MAGVSANGTPTIDGTLSSGEWDSYYLGTSVTAWAGGMSVDVYGFTDNTNLYAAYKVDIPNSPGFAMALILGIPPNFYYRTPQTASWPQAGYTIFEMTYPRLMQTDGSGWAVVYPDLASMLAAGIEIGLDTNWWSHNGEAELKIPLSLLTYANADGQIRLNGQYWQYDGAEPFYVNIPPFEVEIDIKPWSDPNSVNRKNKKGVTPVGILGGPNFDPTLLDDGSDLTFVFNEEPVTPKHDLSDPLVFAEHIVYPWQPDPDNQPLLWVTANNDLIPDLVVHFNTRSLNISGNRGDILPCTLIVKYDGNDWLQGSDDIRIVK